MAKPQLPAIAMILIPLSFGITGSIESGGGEMISPLTDQVFLFGWVKVNHLHPAEQDYEQTDAPAIQRDGGDDSSAIAEKKADEHLDTEYDGPHKHGNCQGPL
jgi:hypothetical protein